MSKTMKIVIVCILACSNGAVYSQTLERLSSLKWINRIVVINEPRNIDEILPLLENNQHEIEERDIVWFILTAENTRSNYLGDLADKFSKRVQNQYGLAQGQVILIGKDGGLKSSFEGINLSAIFFDIDAMPMRQQEMKK